MQWPSTILQGRAGVHIAGLCSLVAYSYLAWLSQDISQLTLSWFFVVIIPVFGLMGWVFLQTRRGGWSLSFADVLLWAAAFRIAGVWGAPIFEDDFFRYLWDGYRLYESGDPYSLAPSVFFGDTSVPTTYQRILDGINYPDIPTIYAPTLQLSFLLGHWLTPGDLLGLKLVYVSVDLLLIVVLHKMVASTQWVLLYAWNPLVIKEIAFTAHPDGFGVFFLVLACFYELRGKPWLTMLCLGLSVCAKPFAWFVAPFILWNVPKRFIPVFVISVLVLYLPFILQSSQVLTGLFAFGRDWQFNAAIFSLLSAWLPVAIAKPLCISIFLGAFAAYFLRFTRNPTVPVRYDWILAGLLLFSPVLNAWYWVWVLPFAVLYPSRWVWVASCTLLLSYVAGINMDDSELSAYQIPVWILALEYGVIALVMLEDGRVYRRKRTYQQVNLGTD